MLGQSILLSDTVVGNLNFIGMKGNLLFCSLNLDELGLAKDMEIFAGKPITEYFQRVDFAIKNSRDFRLELVGKDGKDILRDWIKLKK